MDGLGGMGKFLIIAGLILAAVGAIFWLSGKIPWLGRLPGDLVIHKRNVTVHIPIVTSLLISVVLTLVLNLIFRR